MELTNEFRVALPVDQAWTVLTDVERIAPCLPGAQLQEIEGDEYRGIVKIKVGPITANYKGVATFASLDEVAHVAVLRAEGRETRGQGNANATITATLVADGDGTAVTVITDLQITGKVAQFGRGVLADVSTKLLGQFVDCLEQTVLVEDPAPVLEVEPVDVDLGDPMEAFAPEDVEPALVPAEPEAAPAPPAVRTIDSPEPQAVDLLDAAGTPVAKRVGPILAAVAIIWILKKLLGRRR
jgi:carbon monoxide dehydrogenase subunit G